ncbi:MAG: hypothetical protein RLZZ301_1778 [Bacteroidota bacterium]|jgi:chaperonin cofactor prefoldin
MKQLKTYQALIDRNKTIHAEKQTIEAQLKADYTQLIHHRNWLSSSMKILSSTFKDVEESPAVMIAESLIHLYKQHSQKQLDPNQSILEHLFELLRSKEQTTATNQQSH